MTQADQGGGGAAAASPGAGSGGDPAAAGAPTQGAGGPPSVVLIVVDDLGVAAVGADELANEDAYSPHLDELAASGVRVRQGYAADGMCWPSRGSLLTGLYPQRWNMKTEFSEERATIADVLSERGYATACIGKWHNGDEGPYHPLERGFDEFFGFLGGAHDYFDPNVGYKSGDGGTTEVLSPIYDGRTPVSEMRYLTDELTERAVSFIERHRDAPFFLYLAYNARHAPNQYPADYAERFPGQEIGHVQAVEAILDENVGRLVDALEALGLREDTLVVFVGDNGGNKRTNGPLRDRKGSLYEGGLRVPWIVSWPARLPAGAVREGPVMHVDLAPTIAAAAGSAVNDSDGFDVLPLLDGTRSASPHSVLFWGIGNRGAVRRGDWKLVTQNGATELFDLARDPFEQKDVAAQEPEQVARLQADLDSWRSAL